MAKDICKQICGITFSMPNATRWNSLYDAVKKFVRVKDLIPKVYDRIINELRPKNFVRFSKQEIILFCDYVTCMEPIANSLDYLQGDNVSLGDVLPTIFNIKH